MNLEDPVEEQRRYRVELVVLAAIVGVAVVALIATVIVRTSGGQPTDAEPTPAVTTAPQVDGSGEPRLAGPADLRSGPADNVAIVTRLAQTDAIRIVGRSESGDWLAVAVIDRPQLVGWVRTDAILDVQVAGLPVVAAPGGSTLPPGTSPTLTPDLPDLVISGAFAVGNILHIEIYNQGAGDAMGELAVAVNGGPPQALDLKGVPLHPGQAALAAVPGEYVQLRTAIALLLLPDPELEEEDHENNGWSGVIEPDQPNDMEITAARVADDGALVVTVRNNSPIPITGSLTVSVREALPSTRLLGRHVEAHTIAAGGEVDITFPEITDADLSRTTISISTTAIDDATLQNNSYPR